MEKQNNKTVNSSLQKHQNFFYKPLPGGENTYCVDEGDLRGHLPRKRLLRLHCCTNFVLRNYAQRASGSSHNVRVQGIAWPSHMSVYRHPDVPLIPTIFRRRVHGDNASGSRIARGGRQTCYVSTFLLNIADVVNQLVPAVSMSNDETLIKQPMKLRIAEISPGCGQHNLYRVNDFNRRCPLSLFFTPWIRLLLTNNDCHSRSSVLFGSYHLGLSGVLIQSKLCPFWVSASMTSKNVSLAFLYHASRNSCALLHSFQGLMTYTKLQRLPAC